MAKIQSKIQTIDDQIAAWKKEHGDGNIYQINVSHKKVNPDVKLKAYIKTPGIITMSKLHRYGEEHIAKSVEVFMQDSWLGGDPEILKYDEYKIALFTSAMPLFEIPSAEVVKL